MIAQHLHAPSIWTLLAVVISDVKASRQRRRQHADMKQHVTKSTRESEAK